MNVWRKLLTAVRGGAHEVGEAVVDSQALRILDQEIRDADDELHRSREALAGIMAKQSWPPSGWPNCRISSRNTKVTP